MTVRCLILTAIALIAIPFSGRSQSAQPAATIVEHFENSGHNSVTMPDELYRRMIPVVTAEEDEESSTPTESVITPGHAAGFRVQVFSDNNTRTAKNEARAKSKMIAARFPQYATYVRYTSPYWRLKVGDFRSQQDANEAAEELRKAFPAFGKEIRVVRDRINITE